MMKRIIMGVFLALFVLTGACHKETGRPVQLIFDTDMGPDFDDVGALTVLHALADSGEVNILATLSSNLDPLAVPCIDVINTYYGRPDIPVGAPKAGVNMGDHWHRDKWTEALTAQYPHKWQSTAEAPDAVQVYRKTLSAAADTSVVIVTVGFLTNLADLMESSPDQFSPLGGMELVQKKVKRLVSMAGVIPEGWEFNVTSDSTASQKVFALWPTPVIISPFGIGDKILTGKRLVASDISDTPAKTAFAVCLRQADPNGRMSWDETAALVAVRGTRDYFETVKGRMIAAPNGSNTWQDDPGGPHEYLKFKMKPDEIGRIIEDMMMHERK